MIGNDVIADSNVILDLMRGNANAINKFQSFVRISITPVILSELYFGAYRSANLLKNITKIKLATQHCRILTVNETTADHVVTIKLALQAKGKSIPENDVWIAASAIQHALAVYTNDVHFTNIDGLALV